MNRFAPSFSSNRLFTKLAASGMVALSLFTLTAPATQASSGSLEITGWIPYWATAKGTADADANLSNITEVNPFGYSVKADGTLSDTMNLSDSNWQDLFRNAKRQGVKVVPTVMWSDTGSIYSILSDSSSRTRHINSIVQAVKQNGFDGIDIDYEGKSAETRDSYSAFLTELSAALYKANPNAELDCTIEARMPLSARYSGTPPANIEYANDLPVINKVCDRVRIMTYDQDTADLQLNAAHSNTLYAPVSDTAWVKKVVDYMSTDISKKKMLIGVATYGTEWQAMSDPDGKGFTYTKLMALNPQSALNLAQQNGVTPSRNVSGELSFSFVDKNQTPLLPSNSQLQALAPQGTPSGLLAAAGALAYSKHTNKQAPVTFVTWSDAQAIQDKATLAKSMGVAGIAVFKFDGGEDPDMWNSIASVATAVKNPSLGRSTNGDSSSSSNSSSSPDTSGSFSGSTDITGCTSTTLFSPVTGARCPVVTPTTTPPVVVPTTPATPTTPSTVGTTGSSTFKRDLQYGMDGTDVTALQKILITKGYLKASANGHFGPATKAAVTAWQKAAGLPATGYFGPLSRAKLKA